MVKNAVSEAAKAREEAAMLLTKVEKLEQELESSHIRVELTLLRALENPHGEHRRTWESKDNNFRREKMQLEIGSHGNRWKRVAQGYY